MGRSAPHTRTTTERGLGNQHQQQRKRLLNAFVDGSLCPFFGVDPKCPGPMYRNQELDADHSDPRDGGRNPGTVADSLAHRACNRRAGQVMSTAIQRDGVIVCDYHTDCGSIHSRAWRP